MTGAAERGTLSPDTIAGGDMGLRIRLRGDREQGAAGDPAEPVLSDPGTVRAPRGWFVAVDGVHQGPFESADVRARVAAGHVTEDSLVWHEGMVGWIPLRGVPELGGLGGAAAR